jgi:hypothetical protein
MRRIFDYQTERRTLELARVMYHEIRKTGHRWSTTLSGDGSILSQKWPHDVPFSVHYHEKRSLELDRDA